MQSRHPRRAPASNLRALVSHHQRLAHAWLAAAARFEAADVPALAQACRSRGEVEQSMARALREGDLAFALETGERVARETDGAEHRRLLRCLEGIAWAADERAGGAAALLLDEDGLFGPEEGRS